MSTGERKSNLAVESRNHPRLSEHDLRKQTQDHEHSESVHHKTTPQRYHGLEPGPGPFPVIYCTDWESRPTRRRERLWLPKHALLSSFSLCGLPGPWTCAMKSFLRPHTYLFSPEPPSPIPIILLELDSGITQGGSKRYLGSLCGMTQSGCLCGRVSTQWRRPVSTNLGDLTLVGSGFPSTEPPVCLYWQEIGYRLLVLLLAASDVPSSPAPASNWN